MLLIVQEIHPTVPQDVTVKNVAISQDSSVKHTKRRRQWGRWKKVCTSPIVLKLVREKVFTCERDGSGRLSCFNRDDSKNKISALVFTKANPFWEEQKVQEDKNNFLCNFIQTNTSFLPRCQNSRPDGILRPCCRLRFSVLLWTWKGSCKTRPC